MSLTSPSSANDDVPYLAESRDGGLMCSVCVTVCTSRRKQTMPLHSESIERQTKIPSAIINKIDNILTRRISCW